MPNRRNKAGCERGHRERDLNAKEHSADLKCWAPLILQNVKANATEFVYVRVVDLGEEANLHSHIADVK